MSHNINQPSSKTNWTALTGLIIAVVALLTCLIPFVNNLTFFGALLGVVVGAIAWFGTRGGRRPGKGLAVTAVVLSVLSIVGVLGSQAWYGAQLEKIGGQAPTTGTTEEAPKTKAFGETTSYPDGLKITLSKPAPFKPSSTASTSDADARWVVSTVTVVNGSAKNYNPVLLSVNGSVNGAEAGRVFDSKNKIGTAPSSEVLPGKSVTFRVVFGIPTKDPVELQLDASLGLSHKTAIYVGQV